MPVWYGINTIPWYRLFGIIPEIPNTAFRRGIFLVYGMVWYSFGISGIRRFLTVFR